MVRWQERRSHPHLPQERLRTRQEPRIQGGQKEHFGQQGEQERRELEPSLQVCLPNSVDCEYLFDLINVGQDYVKESLFSTLGVGKYGTDFCLIWIILSLRKFNMEIQYGLQNDCS